MKKHRMKKSSVKLSMKELRASYLSRMNQLGEDRASLLRVTKEFFAEYFGLRGQISFDDLPGLLEKKHMAEDAKDDVRGFAEYLVEAEYSPNVKTASFAIIEERFRKIVFLLTMQEDEDNHPLKPVKRATRKYLSPIKKIYRHFVLSEEAQDDYQRFKELSKKCIAYAKTKQYPIAKREYQAMLRRYNKMVPAARDRSYGLLEAAHHAMVRCIPHEAYIQKILEKAPKHITSRNRNKWKGEYERVLKHYAHLSDDAKVKYYTRIRTLRLQVMEEKTS